jgi:hypothetical protein
MLLFLSWNCKYWDPSTTDQTVLIFSQSNSDLITWMKPTELLETDWQGDLVLLLYRRSQSGILFCYKTRKSGNIGQISYRKPIKCSLKCFFSSYGCLSHIIFPKLWMLRFNLGFIHPINIPLLKTNLSCQLRAVTDYILQVSVSVVTLC